MKMSILTRDIEVSKSIDIINQAAKIASDEKSEILILPGYYGCSHPYYSHLKKIQEISHKNNLKIVAEAATNNQERKTFLVEPSGKKNMSFTQHFKKGNEEKEAYKQLNNSLLKGQRDFLISGKKVRMLLCGENNYFTNERHNPDEVNKVKIRFNDMSWSYDYDILINPAHSTMGQWNLLNKRFEKLSSQDRVVIYTTNKGKADCKSPKRAVKSWGTSLRVFQNGKLILDGEFKSHLGKVYSNDTWRLVTLTV